MPQALEGVAAVALLYAAVRRAAGPCAALLAGAVFALTPVAALMFRFNNPDALLVLLLVAGAYCVQRACETDAAVGGWSARARRSASASWPRCCRRSWCCPASGRRTWSPRRATARRRVRGLVAAPRRWWSPAGWYLLLVELWPASSRPYIGGSQHNSIVELALGYNGFGRLTGNETGGLGNLNFDVGWGRLFGTGMGGYIAWLLPAARGLPRSRACS